MAQTIELVPGMNTSDRTPGRDYTHDRYGGHKGAYFGAGMEFDTHLTVDNIDQAHLTHAGCRLIKSHDWAYQLPETHAAFPDDWLMLVYRPTLESNAWWHQAGGFNITYPKYDIYQDSMTMLFEIQRQNAALLKFAHDHKLSWTNFSVDWIADNFGHRVAPISFDTSDILVTILK